MRAAATTASAGELDELSRNTLAEIVRNLTLAQIERIVIAARLAECNGKKLAAARSLDVSLSTVYHKLARYRAEDEGG